MNPVATGKLQHVPILRKQSDGRRTFPLENTLQVLGQCKTGALQLGSGSVATQLGPLNKFLGERFHGAQYFGRRFQPDHLQCPYRLVQLLAGDAQMAGIQLGNVRSTRKLCVADKPAHRLGRAIQGFSKLVEHPGQWPQICDHRILVAYNRCVRLHGFVHSCL